MRNLSNLWYTLESIVPDWSHVQLLDNANLSAGWESIDMTNTIHPDFAETAIRATRDMWLRLCGVDIIVWDISRSLMENENGYIILEINGAPWLDNYLCSGARQREHVKDLYRKIILALWIWKISRNSRD
jgi:D-alanine-D-alanine ligase-like ATP-grasp enzyme